MGKKKRGNGADVDAFDNPVADTESSAAAGTEAPPRPPRRAKAKVSMSLFLRRKKPEEPIDEQNLHHMITESGEIRAHCSTVPLGI